MWVGCRLDADWMQAGRRLDVWTQAGRRPSGVTWTQAMCGQAYVTPPSVYLFIICFRLLIGSNLFSLTFLWAPVSAFL